MSGIFGIFRQDSRPVEHDELQGMAAVLQRRGPDHTGIWREGALGLGHTLLATTPELAFEAQPWRHPATGCVIVADARLDNRRELLARLAMADHRASVGDAELILTAYLHWGDTCAEQLLGDFAFAVWDPGTSTLFAARDRVGMRPFYYHNSPERFFALASEPQAILQIADAPRRLNEARVADYLVRHLEGIDKTSTFHTGIYRLPPAHWIKATPGSVRSQCYWQAEPGPELRLASDDDYAQAFLEVFSEAVRCRLRSNGPVGSMLSGGMDSGAVVAVARQLIADGGGSSTLPTFSAVGPHAENCVETRMIQAALAVEGLEPHRIGHHQLQQLLPELADLTLHSSEPFDAHMTLPRAVYLLARNHGTRVVLDGVGGDILFAGGTNLGRLLRQGHWLHAYEEARCQEQFWHGGVNRWKLLYQGIRSAYVPEALRQLRARWRGSPVLGTVQSERCPTLASPELLARIDLPARLRQLASHKGHRHLSPAEQHARAITHPYQVVGRERYDRIASALAIEPRDPFLDQRVIAFCLSLPEEQKANAGWPKIILRRAMAQRMPDTVRWRRGREHLGWRFTSTLAQHIRDRLVSDLAENRNRLDRYIRPGEIDPADFSCDRPNDWCRFDQAFSAAVLATWLQRHDPSSATNR